MLLYLDLVAAALLRQEGALPAARVRAALSSVNLAESPRRSGVLAHAVVHDQLDPRLADRIADWARRYVERHRQATLLKVLELDGCHRDEVHRLVGVFDEAPPGSYAIGVLKKATAFSTAKLVDYQRQAFTLSRAHEARELRRAQEDTFRDLKRPLALSGTHVREDTLTVSALFRSENTVWLVKSERRRAQASDASELFDEDAGQSLFSLPPGATLGPYTIGPTLGEGGMGRVYLATRADGSHVAIKTLLSEFCDPEDHARFEREAKVLSRLEHPSVSRLIEAGTSEDGVRYLVFPALQGETLREALDREIRLPVARAFEHAQELLSALGAIHAAGVIHKDLKPENVMLRDRANPTRVCLIDFGLARIRGQDAHEPTLFMTRGSDLLGTPGYLSPEQVKGEPVTARSDLYAFGVLLFRMLTGKLPFEAKTAYDMLAAHARATPMTLAAVVPEVSWPAPLEELLARLLSKDPKARPQSASEVQDTLASCGDRDLPGNQAVFAARSHQPVERVPTAPTCRPDALERGDAVS